MQIKRSLQSMNLLKSLYKTISSEISIIRKKMKMGKRFEQTPYQGIYRAIREAHKIYSLSLVIREMQKLKPQWDVTMH